MPPNHRQRLLDLTRREPITLVPWALALVVGLAGGPVYLGYDDFVLRGFVEGTAVAGVAPSPMLPYSHPWLGDLLVGLGARWPSVPWYDVLHRGLTLVAALALARCFRRGTTAPPLPTALLATAVLLPFAALAHFSLVSACAAGAGCVLAFDTLSRPPSPTRTAPSLLLAASLVLAGYLVRPHAAMLASVIAALAFSTLLVANGWSRRAVGASLGWAALVAGGCALLRLVALQRFASEPGWELWVQHNALRAHLVEFTATRSFTGADWTVARDAAGWSSNDLALLRRWMPLDPEVFSAARMEAALVARDGTTTGSFGGLSLASGWRGLRSLFMHPLAWAAAALLGIGAARVGRSSARAAAACWLAWALPFLALSVFYKPMNPALLWGTALAPIALGFLASGRPSGTASPWSRRRTVALAMVAAAIAGRLALHGATNDQNRARAERMAADIAALQPSIVFNHTGTAMLYTVAGPFTRRDVLPLPLHPIGGISLSPLPAGPLQRAGRKDAVDWLCHDPSAVLVAGREQLPLLTAWAAEHHGLAVSWEAALASGSGVWRCRNRPL